LPETGRDAKMAAVVITYQQRRWRKRLTRARPLAYARGAVHPITKEEKS